MTLRFPTEQMKDVLKSLVLQDLDGGAIGPIAYPSQDPLSRTLQGVSVDLSEPLGVGPLLNQLRGTAVTLSTAEGTVTGSVMSAEQRDGADGSSRWMVTLYGPTGLRTVALDSVQRLQFDDPDLQADLRQALSAVAAARDQSQTPVRLRFEGTGERRVRIGYVVEAPVWKTSYRLILPDGDEGEGRIQGWAVVNNQTDADWDGVALTLVSGRPVSFVQDLYTPTYTDRPVVSPTSGRMLSPRAYEEGVSGSPGRSQSSQDVGFNAALSLQKRSASDTAAAPSAPAQGVAAAASAENVGAFFQYRLSDISLPRGQSALVPIVTEPIAVERLSIYNPQVHATHPLRGARLRNTTGRHLAAGPLTVLDAGSYAGDARLTDTPPDDERLVSYALNQEIQVDRGGSRSEETVASGTIVDGVLRLQRRRGASQTYTIENEGGRDATLLLEHPRRDGWTLAEPADAEETTPSLHRLRTRVDAGETAELTVRQERLVSETWRLAETDRDQLLVYARTGSLPGDVRDALEKAAQLQQAVADTESALERTRRELQDLREEQSRIRSNMQAVGRDTDYHQRLLEKLSTQEDRIASITERIDDLEAERSRHRTRLTDDLRGLTIE